MKHTKLAVKAATTLILAVLGSSFSAVAGNLTNGEVTQIDAGNNLLSTVNSNASASEQWFSYQVDMEPGNGMPCCFTGGRGNGRGCTLDTRHSGWGNDDIESDSSQMDIYFKWDDGTPQQMFFAGSDCPVNAGGQKVVDIQGVSQSKSIEFLSGFIDVEREGKHRKAHGRFMAAIALHNGEVAQNQLQLLTNNDNEDIRHKAIFWMGEARNKAGFDALVEIVDDKSRPMDDRTKAVFGLNQNDHEQAPIKLIELAKNAPENEIQNKALFWLAQSNNPETISVIKMVLASSSSKSVKEKAVFSLSQLDSDEGWTMLVDLAKSADKAGIREKAIFWLSQRGKEDAEPVLLEILNGNNPTSIKEKVVFALSQLPDHQSTPALLSVLRSSQSKAIKKKALFWLGQSNDPQAMAAIEEVLTQ